MIAIRLAAAAALLCAAASPLAAQTPPSKPDATVPGTSAPNAPPATSLDGQSGSLSTKLRDSSGVITPSGDVDPAMHKPPPQTGTMPVIKPGHTGGDSAK